MLGPYFGRAVRKDQVGIQAEGQNCKIHEKLWEVSGCNWCSCFLFVLATANFSTAIGIIVLIKTTIITCMLFVGTKQ